MLEVDQAVGALACVYTVVLLSTRCQERTISEWLGHLPHFLGQLAVALLPFCGRGRRFLGNTKYRVTFLVALRAVLLLHSRKFRRVRLNHSPTSSWVRDSGQALIGLGLSSVPLLGLNSLPRPLRVALQLVSAYCLMYPRRDCATQLMVHPVMTERIQALQQLMRLLAAPILPQAGMLVPKQPEEQCQATVVFGTLLLGVLLPEVLMCPKLHQPAVSSESPGQSFGCSPSRWDDFLRSLQFQHGVGPALSLWWLMLVTLWAASTMPF